MKETKDEQYKRLNEMGKRIPFLRSIQDDFKDEFGKPIHVLQRGEKSYLIHYPSSKKRPFKVMERLLASDSWGYVEILKRTQKHQAFATLEEAERHFQKYEKGLTPLMIDNTHPYFKY